LLNLFFPLKIIFISQSYRLRHNVIKTGIKMISLSYAKISFSDVAQKLQLDSPEDAEYIVAKVSPSGIILLI